MSKLVIRKRVTLEFLGDEYKEAYLDFKSIPVGDYDKLIEDINSTGDDNGKANSTILAMLKKYYLGGKFPSGEGELEDLDSPDELNNLDKSSLLKCFGGMTGQDIESASRRKAELVANGAPKEVIDEVATDVDPKSENQSKPGSIVEHQPQ